MTSSVQRLSRKVTVLQADKIRKIRLSMNYYALARLLLTPTSASHVVPALACTTGADSHPVWFAHLDQWTENVHNTCLTFDVESRLRQFEKETEGSSLEAVPCSSKNKGLFHGG